VDSVVEIEVASEEAAVEVVMIEEATTIVTDAQDTAAAEVVHPLPEGTRDLPAQDPEAETEIEDLIPLAVLEPGLWELINTKNTINLVSGSENKLSMRVPIVPNTYNSKLMYTFTPWLLPI